MKTLLCLAFFSLHFAIAADVSVDVRREHVGNMLNQRSRPTVFQVMELMKEYPQLRRNLKREGERWRLQYRVQAIFEDLSLPLGIAAMEQAFPGATLWELGRDAVLVGDILDAFYAQWGQPGRVMRLDASLPSFQARNFDLIYDFLKTNGIDVAVRRVYPNVLFDTTSYSYSGGVGGGMSQSRQLITAAYLEYTKSGKNPADLLKKLNFVSIGGGGYKFRNFVESGMSPEEMFELQAKKLNNEGFDVPFYIPMDSYTYSSEWHSMFGPFRREGSRVLTDPGEQVSTSQRLKIIQEIIDVISVVGTPEFQASVVIAAALRGYDFPKKRSSKLVQLSEEKVAQARAAYQQLTGKSSSSSKEDKRNKNEKAARSVEGDEKDMLFSKTAPYGDTAMGAESWHLTLMYDLWKEEGSRIDLEEAVRFIERENQTKAWLELLLHAYLVENNPSATDAKVLARIWPADAESMTVPVRSDFPNAKLISSRLKKLKKLVMKCPEHIRKKPF